MQAMTLAAIKGEREDYRIEYRLRHARGDWRWISNQGQVVERGPGGRALRMAGTSECITARKNTEIALRESEATARRLALVASRTQNAAIITDAERRFEWVNDAFTRITGYTLAEVVGAVHLTLRSIVDCRRIANDGGPIG